jgi:hypothetical protein
MLVEYRGKQYRVASVRVRGIAAPHFRLDGLHEGPISYRLVSLVAPDSQTHNDERSTPNE